MLLKKIYILVLICATASSVYTTQDSLQQRLTRAVRQNDIAAVKEALQDGADLTHEAKNNENSINNAFFLYHTAEMHSEDSFFTIDPLLLAIEYGHLDIAWLLVESGARISQSRNAELLERAINQENIALVQLAIKMGADVNQQNRKHTTPLCTAITKDNQAIALILIAAEADLEKQCANGWTPLLTAIIQKKVEMARMLLCCGASANYKNNDGITPLSEAIIQKNKAMVQLLVRAGAHVNSNDRRRWASVFSKLGNPACRVIAEYLLSVGAQLGDWTTNLGQQNKKRLVVMAKNAIEIRSKAAQQCFHARAGGHFPNVLQSLIGDFEGTPISSKQAKIALERVRNYCV